MNTFSSGETVVVVPVANAHWSTTTVLSAEEIAALFEPIRNETTMDRCPWDDWLAGDL